MNPQQIERIATIIMVVCALLGTIWYIILEWQATEDVSAIGWSIVAVVWFVIYRRLLHQWRQRRKASAQQDDI